MKLKNKLSILVFVIMIILICVGCINKNSVNREEVNMEYEVVFNNYENYEAKTKKFSFGDERIKINNKNVQYKTEGVISTPKGTKEKSPVVFIVHGKHSEKSNTDFEDGFKYLTEALAENGIIGISVDASINYTWEFGEVPENNRIGEVIETHINSLRKANEGIQDNYGIDLKDKIDLDKIGLIGHSVGGSGVLKVANEQISKGNNNIKGIIAVTPSYNTPLEKFPDVKTSIIVSEYDGDVMHSGADLYMNILKNDKDRKNPIGLTYLIGGNHNAFNSYLGEKEFSSPQDTDGSYPEKLGRKEQREFLKRYAVDYMKSVFEFENSISPIFNNKETLPNKMYGYTTMNNIYYPKSELLFGKKQFKDIECEDVSTSELVESSMDNDTAKLFSVLEFTKGIDLLEINWSKKGGFINIPLSSNELSKYNEISIEWALNSPNELNSKDEPVKFDLIIESLNGNEVVIPILGNEISSMRYIYGIPVKAEYLEGKYLEYWSRKTPISTFTIPLEKIKGGNLSEISNIKLEFNDSEKGSIFIKSISAIE